MTVFLLNVGTKYAFSYVSYFDKLLGDNDFYLLKDVDLNVHHTKIENKNREQISRKVKN